MPPSCCCPSSASWRPTIRASSRLWRRSSASSRTGDWLYRYRHVDDFGHAATAFTICGFWYVRRSPRSAGERRRASGSSACWPGAPGSACCPRTSTPTTGELWGNFPQTYSMVGHRQFRGAPEPQLGGRRMSRLVAVSNRISIPRKGAAPGGLAVGVLPAMQARGGLWFGWSGEVVRRDACASHGSRAAAGSPSRPSISRARTTRSTTRLLQRRPVAALSLFRSTSSSSSMLSTRPISGSTRQFAERLLRMLRADDLVWVHDYHLIPLGQRLRDARGAAAARLLPARAVSAHRGAADAARVRGADARAARLRHRSASRRRATSTRSTPACASYGDPARSADGGDRHGRRRGGRRRS